MIDAATFGCSAVCLALLQARESKPSRTKDRFLTALTAGIRHVFHTVPLRQIVVTLAVALLVVGFSETLIFAVIGQGLHRPPAFLGVTSTAQGVGAIAGGLTAATMLRRVGDARLVALGLVVFAVGDLLLVVMSLPVVLIGFTMAGVGLPWAIVGFATAMQQRTPPELQGRVYSAADTLVGTPQTVSIAVGAELSTLFDYRFLLVIMFVVTSGCALYLATRRIDPVQRLELQTATNLLDAEEVPSSLAGP